LGLTVVVVAVLVVMVLALVVVTPSLQPDPEDLASPSRGELGLRGAQVADGVGVTCCRS